MRRKLTPTQETGFICVVHIKHLQFEVSTTSWLVRGKKEQVLSPMSSKVVVSDEGRGDCAAEAEHGGGHDDDDRRADRRDQRAHGQREHELSQEDHARDDAHVRADAPSRLAVLHRALNILRKRPQIVITVRHKVFHRSYMEATPPYCSRVQD